MWMASGASIHGHNPGHGGPHVRLEEVAEPLGRIVASLHRKRLGARLPGRRRKLRAGAFSIRRLEGSRWRLRRALAMGIGRGFGTDGADNNNVGDGELAETLFRMEICGSWIGSKACDRVGG